VIDFKPSHVVLAVPPLTGTMGRAEREHAAAIIVRTCQVQGDEWKSVTEDQVMAMLTADLEAGTQPFVSLIKNPFFKPDPAALVAAGFAKRDGEALELTAKGIEALRPCVRLQEVSGA